MRAVLNTSVGNIEIDLFSSQAPITVQNFVALATDGKMGAYAGAYMGSGPLYNGTKFHRVIRDFMIQGGDPTGTGRGGPGYKFQDEFDPSLRFNRPYLVAMANAGPGTNGSQFFITLASTPFLNDKHTIFGEVTDSESQQVVNQIGRCDTKSGDQPVSDIIIKEITIED
ncbi:peptidylprolyl isomerase [Collimonas sp.]|uniref:peptidylprolyl isomerase n=1 Tax=Collimonas sp. TaxID=1963772 RepID=UPI002B7A287F|nr:peptidylprolyl isomerase [Collimonas sp.]HWX02376.1 peptidylprolyl isomerase [Collimonas sp.]